MSVEGTGFHPANPAVSEPGEALPVDHRAWLGGVFDVGGTMGFTIVKYKGKRYGYPEISYHDNNEQRVATVLEALKELSHEPHSWRYRKKRGQEAWVFKITGTALPPIISEFEPYMPSRKIVTEAFADWETSSLEARVEMAQQLGLWTRSEVDVEFYRELMHNPHFLAGIVDSRGGWAPHSDSTTGRFYLTSINRSLLTALRGEFGGSIRHSIREEAHAPDEEVRSFSWTIENNHQLGQLVLATYPYLRFPEQIRFR